MACREANTTRGKAKCCICLESPLSAVLSIHTHGGALTITYIIIYIYKYEDFIGQIMVHEDDINSTCYSGEASQLIYSACDDGQCKVRGHPSFRL